MRHALVLILLDVQIYPNTATASSSPLSVLRPLHWCMPTPLRLWNPASTKAFSVLYVTSMYVPCYNNVYSLIYILQCGTPLLLDRIKQSMVSCRVGSLCPMMSDFLMSDPYHSQPGSCLILQSQSCHRTRLWPGLIKTFQNLGRPILDERRQSRVRHSRLPIHGHLFLFSLASSSD
jgi:hypothetical protein